MRVLNNDEEGGFTVAVFASCIAWLVTFGLGIWGDYSLSIWVMSLFENHDIGLIAGIILSLLLLGTVFGIANLVGVAVYALFER